MSLLDPPNLRARIEQIVLEVLKDNHLTDPQSSDINVLKAQLFEAKHHLTFFTKLQDLINEHNAKLNP